MQKSFVPRSNLKSKLMHATENSAGRPDTPKPAQGNTSFTKIVGRSLRLRCPRCGGGRLFRGYFAMYENCPSCKLTYERGPGYFLGSTYINYGLTALLMTIGFVLLRFGVGIEKTSLLLPLGIFAVLFPLLFFRFSRSLWLGMDSFIDRTDFRDESQGDHGSGQ